MIEMVLVAATGTLPIGLGDVGTGWVIGEVNLVNSAVLPMLGNAQTTPSAPPPKPCLVLHMDQESMVNGVVTPMLGGALTTPGTTPPNPR
jgi:hypothetical protein